MSDLCTRRLTKELRAYGKDPIRDPLITIAPNERNLREMHYVIEGSPDTPYHGGVYHGKLLFPKEYPLKPPSVLMLTPNGRFQQNRRLCLSMSDFHPESWNPMWSVSTILTGLYSFMLERNPTLGSIETTHQRKRQLAAVSLAWNCTHGDPQFAKLFPHYVKRYEKEQQEARDNAQQNKNNNSTTNGLASSVHRREGNLLFLPGAVVAMFAGIGAIIAIVAAYRFVE